MKKHVEYYAVDDYINQNIGWSTGISQEEELDSDDDESYMRGGRYVGEET